MGVVAVVNHCPYILILEKLAPICGILKGGEGMQLSICLGEMLVVTKNGTPPPPPPHPLTQPKPLAML